MNGNLQTAAAGQASQEDQFRGLGEQANVNMIVLPKTVRENLDNKISQAQRRLDSLKMARIEMEKAGMLDLNIENLRTAMNY